MSGKCDDTIIKYLLPVQKRCVSLAEPMKSRRLAHKRKSPEMNKHTSSFVAVSKCLQCCTGFFSSHLQCIVQILKVVLINSSSHFTAKKKQMYGVLNANAPVYSAPKSGTPFRPRNAQATPSRRGGGVIIIHASQPFAKCIRHSVCEPAAIS